MWHRDQKHTQHDISNDPTSVNEPTSVYAMGTPHVQPSASHSFDEKTASDTSPQSSAYSPGINSHRSNLILGRYRPLEQAGAGGFSTVQVAWDTRIQRKVAIKCMPLYTENPIQEVGVSSAEEIGKTQAFAYDAANVPGLEEARTAAMLSDPHIVGVHDFAVQNNMAYLIMEYVDGASLGDLLRKCPDQITLDVVGAVFKAVSSALEVAHENAVLHLDIKPDNVLIDHKGEVKVADFGLSRLANGAGYAQAAGGTIGYMPPEQMNQQQLDQRCDEWALASMTYEMITGQNPFRAPDIPESLERIYDAEIPFPHLCMQDLDPAADDVLFYALDPDPEQRYDTVRDFAEVLQPYLGNANRGKKKLCGLIDLLKNDDGEEQMAQSQMPQRQGQAKPLYTDFTEPSKPVHTRLDPRTIAHVIERVLAVVCVGILAFVALANSPWISSLVQMITTGGTVLPDTSSVTSPSAPGGLGNTSTTGAAGTGTLQPLFWVIWIAVCILAGFFPQVGLLVAMCLFALAALVHAQYGAAIAIVVISIIWFASDASDHRSSVVSASPALWGSMGFSSFSPLMCGWGVHGSARAAGNAAFALFIALCLASLGSNSISGFNLGVYYNGLNGGFQTRMLSLVARPATWIIGATWCFSAAVMSQGMDHGKRSTQVIYAVFAGVILVAGIICGAWFASGFVSAMPAQTDLALGILAAAFGCALPFVPASRSFKHDDDDE